MKYLIACDLDGSILNDLGELTKTTINTLTTLKNHGHIVVIATGRSFEGAIAKYHQLSLNTPLITDNGGSIENPIDLNFAKQKTYMPLHIVRKLFTDTKPFIVAAVFSEDNTIYAYNFHDIFKKYFNGYQERKIIECEFSKLDVAPTGLTYLVNVEHEKQFQTYIDAEFSDILSYRLWGTKKGISLYEVYLKHISKSSALAYLLDFYSLSNKQLIAFGDGINDIEMLRDAYLGVAMKNALGEVKEFANDVTKSTNDEDGVAKYLIDYFKLK